MGLRSDGELPGGLFHRGAYLTGETGATDGPVKADTDDRITRDIVPRRPFDTGLPLGTLSLVHTPIDDKGLQVIAVFDPDFSVR